MKSIPSRCFPLAIVLGLASAFAPLGAQEAAKTPAIIVIRHAEDAARVSNTEQRRDGVDADHYGWPSETWRRETGETATVKSSWPAYGGRSFIFIKPDGTPGRMDGTVTVSSHGLSGKWKTAANEDGTDKEPYGEDQAVSLGENLDQFLAKNNIAEITRAITMDPSNLAATTNPFDTLWPYLKDKTGIDYYLVQYQPGKEDRFEGLMNLIVENKVLPNTGSTIICWTGEGMSGEKGVVAKLLEKYRGKTYEDWLNKGLMRRCNDMYIFSGPADGNGTAQWWSFNYAAKGETAFTLKDKHPADAKY